MPKPTKTPTPPAEAPAKTRKRLGWVGASQGDFQGLPAAVKDQAGRLLLDLQYGDEVKAMEPMSIVGAGVSELKVDVGNGWFRVFVVMKFEEALYVLHSFQKKTNQTPKRDIEIGQQRYALLLSERNKRLKK
ncbi:type II toxin-antitoxin system RelE/ParE family toxin [Nevskia ramosa]|uniref:type II toxin-antitoxin system RelE/ParE family toxin n=1 Tax=Nevskia ramosa TaxID=64002 RepID=UPI002352C2BD|nr:type II toxin-antitoxin system RelE/ParE family toxin [Nevskia ramosa]